LEQRFAGAVGDGFFLVEGKDGEGFGVLGRGQAGAAAADGQLAFARQMAGEDVFAEGSAN